MSNRNFVDTEELSAWPTGGGLIRIQTRVPAIAEAVRRLKDTWQIGESEKGPYLRLFHTTQPQRRVRRTLEAILTRIFPQEPPSQKPRRLRGRSSRYGDSGRFQLTRCRASQRQKLPTQILDTRSRRGKALGLVLPVPGIGKAEGKGCAA